MDAGFRLTATPTHHAIATALAKQKTQTIADLAVALSKSSDQSITQPSDRIANTNHLRIELGDAATYLAALFLVCKPAGITQNENRLTRNLVMRGNFINKQNQWW